MQRPFATPIHLIDFCFLLSRFAGRPASSAPAAGRKATHLMETSQILKAALQIS